MDSISLSSAITAAGHQVSCEVGGEAVLLNLKSGRYYGLDAVGRRIWELIQQPRSVREICDVLVAEYDGLDRERCYGDVIALLDELADRELIQVTPEP